jgi:hypothetical protein
MLRPNEPRSRAATGGLAIVLCLAAVGCNSMPLQAESTCGTAIIQRTPAETAQLGPPRSRLLLVAKAVANPADVESYYKSKLLPAMLNDRRVGNVEVYTDVSTSPPTYLVQIDVRSNDYVDYNLALAILAGSGMSTDQAAAVFQGFAKLIDVKSAEVLPIRADLSMSTEEVAP